ncbi:MAG: hypothetical protein QM487_14295 [Candidatus Marithrix sp.]
MSKVSKVNINILKSYIDGKINLSTMLEMLDGPAIGLALNTLNDKFGHLIPDSFDEVVHELVTNIVAEDWTKVADNVAHILSELINTPFIDGTTEELEAYKMVLNAIVTMILNFSTKEDEEKK